jgi:two-component system cell cycle sensor histidine kinase PleC
LAIAQSLTELHGGTMQIRSTLGKGTMVLLRLPIGGRRTQKAEMAATTRNRNQATPVARLPLRGKGSK